MVISNSLFAIYYTFAKKYLLSHSLLTSPSGFGTTSHSLAVLFASRFCIISTLAHNGIFHRDLSLTYVIVLIGRRSVDLLIFSRHAIAGSVGSANSTAPDMGLKLYRGPEEQLELQLKCRLQFVKAVKTYQGLVSDALMDRTRLISASEQLKR